MFPFKLFRQRRFFVIDVFKLMIERIDEADISFIIPRLLLGVFKLLRSVPILCHDKPQGPFGPEKRRHFLVELDLVFNEKRSVGFFMNYKRGDLEQRKVFHEGINGV